MAEALGTLAELRRALDGGETTSVALVERSLARAASLASLGAFVGLRSDAALREAAESDARRARIRRALAPRRHPDRAEGQHRAGGRAVRLRLADPRRLRVAVRRDGGCEARARPARSSSVAPTWTSSRWARRPSTRATGRRGTRGIRRARRAAPRAGPAAAVAAGIVPLAFGSDTGGSIRQPASFTGIVGLKPTYGRVSRYGLVAFAISLDQIGPLARTAADCAAALDVVSGRDACDSTSLAEPATSSAAALGGDVAGMTIGLPREYLGGAGCDPEVARAVEDGARELEKAGAVLRPVSLPHTPARGRDLLPDRHRRGLEQPRAVRRRPIRPARGRRRGPHRHVRALALRRVRRAR